MKPYYVLGLAAIAFVIGAVAGLLGGGMAGLVGASVFSFAVLFSISYSLEVRSKRRKAERGERPVRTTEGDVVGFDPGLETVRKDEDVLNETETVASYMREFGVPREKAQSLYDSGYRRMGDFKEAIPEDLIMVKGMNPTLARRIISTVRGKL